MKKQYKRNVNESHSLDISDMYQHFDNIYGKHVPNDIVRYWEVSDEWLVFYVAFNNLSVISRRWLLVAWDAICARVLSAANTDAPCRRHKTRIHHPVTLSWHRANQSWIYPLNPERLARKQPVPIFTPLVWCGRGSNPQPPDYEANALSTRPPRRYKG